MVKDISIFLRQVRSYECFKYLHLGIISPIKKKSLPEIAKIVGINSPQSLHHFLANSPWSVTELRKTKTLGNLYGLRSWVEYGFRQCKQELGWTDYRFTQFPVIERWWEIIMSAYLMVSLNTQAFLYLQLDNEVKKEAINFKSSLSIHPQWNHKNGWKNVLNNLRLILQATLLLWLLSPWLDIFFNSSLYLGLHDLIHAINQLQPFYSSA